MIVSLNQLQMGIIDFIEKEIASKAIGLQRFAYYGASFLVADNAEKVFRAVVDMPIVKQIGFLDENNNIDLDKLYNTAKHAIQKSGKITIGGVILGEDDVEKLYAYIKNVV